MDLNTVNNGNQSIHLGHHIQPLIAGMPQMINFENLLSILKLWTPKHVTSTCIKMRYTPSFDTGVRSHCHLYNMGLYLPLPLPGEVSVCMKFQLTLLSCCVVYDVHVSRLHSKRRCTQKSFHQNPATGYMFDLNTNTKEQKQHLPGLLTFMLVCLNIHVRKKTKIKNLHQT